MRTGRGRDPAGRARDRRRLVLGLALAAVTFVAGAEGWQLEGFTLKNEPAGFRVGLTGYLQLDGRDYFGWTTADPENKPLADTLDVRRVRTGLALEWRRLSAEFDVDWTGDLRDLVGDGGVAYPAAEVKDLFVQYRFSKALALKVGAFKVPVSPEFLTSASKTDFVERSLLASSLAPDRDWGLALSGEVGRRVEYQAGLFRGDGRTAPTRAETTLAARLVWKALQDVDLAGAFAQGRVAAEPDGPGTDPSPKGFSGRSPTDYRFYERKFVDGRRLRWGLDATWKRGPVDLRGEWLQGREQRLGQSSTLTDLPEQVGSGWAFTANWVVTGEKKARTLRPRTRAFAGPGLIELSARYEEIRFDDAGPDEGFAGVGSRARNIRPAGERAFWAGLSWLPAGFVRLYADVVWETYRDPLLAPEPPGAKGLDHPPRGRGSYVSLLARLQLHVP